MIQTMPKKIGLQQQLHYEKRLAARYRFFVSVVMVAPKDEGTAVRSLLDETLRECDEVFAIEGGVAILMPHTNIDDAMAAVVRFKCFCGDRIDLRFSVATYPRDDAAHGLLHRARTRLAEAKLGAFGEVVVND